MAQLLWKPNKCQNKNKPKQIKIPRKLQPNPTTDVIKFEKVPSSPEQIFVTNKRSLYQHSRDATRWIL